MSIGQLQIAHIGCFRCAEAKYKPYFPQAVFVHTRFTRRDIIIVMPAAVGINNSRVSITNAPRKLHE